METFDISWGTILKVSGSGVVLYLVAPLLLILRDLLITKFIEKYVLTQTIRDSIHQCEADRWLLDNKYNEPLIMDSGEYYIGEKKVTEEQYNCYEKGMWKHQRRFELFDSKIQFRNDIINYAMNHFKNSCYVNPIVSLRASSYRHKKEMNSYS
ncbi:hypothetical protein [Vibrio sp. T20]|uniref:hypothetical protein n=1 Tax=Vibrio sp. T20 TaxID=2588450 RepID=UPI0011B3EE89|nr:hypothetical protein [Vibrio sp. T20]